MSDHSSNLNIRAETLVRLSQAYHGYAEILEESGKLPLAGSCYTIAGMYTAIFDQGLAPVLFKQAADVYRRANNSYWKLLAVCSLDLDNFSETDQSFTQGNNPQELYYDLMRQFYLYSRRRENFLNKLLEYISSLPIFLALPIGKSGITLQTYISIIRVAVNRIDTDRDRDESGLFENMQILFEKNEEQFQLMKAHSNHWRDQISIIPFEPDLLATLLCLHFQLDRRVLNFFRERTIFRESPMMAAMDIAGEMINPEPPPQQEESRISRRR